MKKTTDEDNLKIDKKKIYSTVHCCEPFLLKAIEALACTMPAMSSSATRRRRPSRCGWRAGADRTSQTFRPSSVTRRSTAVSWAWPGPKNATAPCPRGFRTGGSTRSGSGKSWPSCGTCRCASVFSLHGCADDLCETDSDAGCDV